ncbi:hypothetical protein [Virgibacillus chiguensis]|uniref:Uncharacterized protein n=1 Tax=Virgibacillus chiguensis TaxID=411959 RepID=A0A1M5VHS7_9BACI|nr:hypothetical protein [Virgibacillus chiguensis]SHH74760.1 hypothetical protein SAMN05421807_112126 [Virgibacillus chiguensis]
MNLEEHFLPKDISHASKEYMCAIDLAERTVNAMCNAKYDDAEMLARDLLKSVGVLNEMSSHKYNQDKFYATVQDLASRKINVEAIQRQYK